MHLAQTFEILRKFNLKLNPKKCSIGVESGKFLGHMVSQCRIKMNPSKINVILDMNAPQKECAKIDRLLSNIKHVRKCKLFFDTIKKGKFKWTTQSQLTFEDIKEYLSNTPILAKLILIENLYLYLAASKSALSVVLVRVVGHAHLPIYFISQT